MSVSSFKPVIAKIAIALLMSTAAFISPACSSSETDQEGNRLPSDSQVVADVTPADADNVIDVRVVAGKSGESYLHSSNFVWTFDRGVVIRRKADLTEAPDAVLVVGGLARYVYTGTGYEYSKFLVSYNEYEGIDAPSPKELRKYVQSNLDKVFISREHNILAIENVELKAKSGWTWHTPMSFTAPFEIRYQQRSNNTTVEDRTDTFDIRFYRQSIDSPLHALMATETARNIIGANTHDAAAIDQMKTLRTNFK